MEKENKTNEELVEEKSESLADETTAVSDSKPQKNPTGALLCLATVILGGGLYLWANQDPMTSDEVTLEDFQTFPEKDVVVVDQGVVEHDAGLADFIDAHSGQEGLHVYDNPETNERYAYITGEEGMEPLALMLYGIVEASEDEIVVGYNYVEASPRFQHSVPSILLNIDADTETSISGRLVVNDEFEHPDAILERFEEEGFEPLTDDELDEISEEEWSELDSADEIEHIESEQD